MKKRFVAIIMAAALLVEGTTLMAQQVEVQETTKVEQAQIAESKEVYMTKVGKLTEINGQGENYSLLVGTMEDGILFNIKGNETIVNAETLEILTVDQLKEGMEVTVIYPKAAPMGLSLPAFCSAQVAIVVNPLEKFFEVGYFNEELVNEKGSLALNVDTNTAIIKWNGERKMFVADDIKGQNAIVVYTTTTRSIPAQTTPEMVLILPSEKEYLSAEQEILEERVQSKEEIAYCSVRDVAFRYDYEVKWDNSSKSVTLIKGDNRVVLMVGEATFKCQGEEVSLQRKVKIDKQKVYVSEDIINYL